MTAGDDAASSPARQCGSWSLPDHVVLVATVAFATLLPPLVWASSRDASWLWLGIGVVATAWTHRLRRAGGLTGVTSPDGKRFLYAVFAFYVVASATSAILVVGPPGPPSLVSLRAAAFVLAPASVVGAVTWAIRSSAED